VIRIQKSNIIPQRLLIQGKAKRKYHCAAYSRNPEAYQSGQKQFDFDRTIYTHPSVKDALICDQHGKCCYCERLIEIEGDVEHFRPKSATQQTRGDSLQRPGYYWLAYDWQNLCFSCKPCNQNYKKNLFPLQNASTRATNHKLNLDLEHPLLIDVTQEDPETMIQFRGTVPYAIDNNSKGLTTIEVLKLNTHNKEARLKHLQKLKMLHDVINLSLKQSTNLELQQLSDRAKQKLEEATKPQAEFAGAARSAIQTNFKYVPD
jgi:uncharacterized protein (TIGR02646 family)